jgi:hypothetical protein
VPWAGGKMYHGVMLRNLLKFVAALSVVLCVETCVVWVRSYRTWDSLLFVAPRWHISATTLNGRVVLQRGEGFDLDYCGIHSGYRSGRMSRAVGGDESDFTQLPLWLLYPINKRVPSVLKWTGISFGDGPHDPSYPPGLGHTVLIVPFAYWIGCFAMRPTMATLPGLHKILRRRRGACPACGYDLRATPERCPECGAQTKNPARAGGDWCEGV